MGKICKNCKYFKAAKTEKTIESMKITPDTSDVDEKINEATMEGDKRVESFMVEILKALERNNIQDEAKVDIYNRCYEVIYKIIIENWNKK